MAKPILIVGQGLAGTLLGWALERAGLAFEIIDAGHAHAASRAAAGIINPITGRRLVKSWRIDELLPLARETYRGMEEALGVPLWREMRVRRRLRDERERRVLAAKLARGELAPFATGAEADGFWIAPAARVDVPALLAATRQRWLAAGKLREGRVVWAELGDADEIAIDCTGAALRAGAFADDRLTVSKGETLQVDVAGLAPEVILNDGHWLLPLDAHAGWVGATHEPGVTDTAPTAAARATLLAAATALAGRVVTPRTQLAGLRLAMLDKHPLAGRHPGNPRLGVCGALGAKGALYAPWLARQWVDYLTRGAAFDPTVTVGRGDG